MKVLSCWCAASIALVSACGSPPQRATSRCLDSVSTAPYSPPPPGARVLAAVDSIVTRWPTGDRLSLESGRIVAPLQRQAANRLLELGEDTVRAALLSILFRAEAEGDAFSGAGDAYYHLRFSASPIQEMLLATNVSEARKRALYRTLWYLEAAPPSSWDTIPGPRRLSAERRAYVCLNVERIFQEESVDSATREAIRNHASTLIILLKSEAISGSHDAAAYLQDSLIQRATTLLVREGYLARESLNPPSPP